MLNLKASMVDNQQKTSMVVQPTPRMPTGYKILKQKAAEILEKSRTTPPSMSSQREKETRPQKRPSSPPSHDRQSPAESSSRFCPKDTNNQQPRYDPYSDEKPPHLRYWLIAQKLDFEQCHTLFLTKINDWIIMKN